MMITRHCTTCRCFPRRKYGARRDEVLAFVKKHPGCTWGQIKDNCAIGDGPLVGLVRRGLLVAKGPRGERRYWVAADAEKNVRRTKR
jgi:hypothetical protein